jgi:hypothetical protein
VTQQQTPAGKRPYNFSAGPAAMPEAVLQRAAAEMLDWQGSGMSVMEMSHRGKEFGAICTQAEADIRALLAIPSHFHILFMQGGGLGENAIVPLNLSRGQTADFVVTGSWSIKSHKEAQRYCDGARGREQRRRPAHQAARSRELAARQGCLVRARVLQRDHQRHRVPRVARPGGARQQGSAGDRLLVARGIAQRRLVPRWPRLRRRAEEPWSRPA